MVKRPKTYQIPMLPAPTWGREAYCDICDIYAACRVVEVPQYTATFCALCLATLLEQVTGVRHRNIMLNNLAARETGAMNERSKDKKAWEEANATGPD